MAALTTHKKSAGLRIAKPGAPKAVLLSLRDYVKLAAPEPKALRIVGEEAVRSGASKLISRQTDRIMREVRAERKTRAAAKEGNSGVAAAPSRRPSAER